MKVYKYGARAKSLGPAIREQMQLGHRYYNRLVEAENKRRTKAWKGDRPQAPPHEDCECKQCKEHWQKIAKRYYNLAPVDKKPLRAQAVKQGLYWGTYLRVEQAFDAAVKTTKPSKSVRFKPWFHAQIAAVQIQDDRRRENLFRIFVADDPRTGRRARGPRGRHTCVLRVGTVPNTRIPIWSEPIQIEIHRVPEGIPRWVIVKLERIADREIASVHFVCSGDVKARADSASKGVVAVDVSWRKVAGGWRIGYAKGDRGVIDELVLGPEWTELADRADRIRSIRAESLNRLKERDSRFTRVRSASGVVRKVNKLREAGETIDQSLQDWIKRDRHLWQYETGCYRHSQARRKDELRRWIRQLRRRYSTVVVKDTKHKDIKATEKDPKKRLPQKARRQGQHAAPGETVELLRQVFGDNGMAVVKAPHTTNLCPECGHVNDHGPETLVTCEGCGAKRDRDWVSTQNMMDLWALGEYTGPTARKKTAKYAKRHNNNEVQQQC